MPVVALLSGASETRPKDAPPIELEPGDWYALGSVESVARNGLSKDWNGMALAKSL